jgi:hypothetical protein
MSLRSPRPNHRRKRDAKLPPKICKATGKRCHITEESAAEQVDSLKENRKRSDRTLSPYECDHCGSWHVGHSRHRLTGG